MGDEEGWIIPTSGHRAYPYWYIPLDEIEFEGDGNYRLSTELTNCPVDLPDHYPTRASPTATKADPRGLLTSLGLWAKPEPINRRI